MPQPSVHKPRDQNHNHTSLRIELPLLVAEGSFEPAKEGERVV
jgi:hypothetical protein